MNSKSFFWLLITVLLTTARLAQAQQSTKIPRIGRLAIATSPNSARHEAFRQGLRELFCHHSRQHKVLETNSQTS